MLEFGKKNNVFHGEIICEGIDLEKIYVRLNENIIKEINLIIEYRDVNNFDFDFNTLLSNEEVDKIKVISKKVLVEGEI